MNKIVTAPHDVLGKKAKEVDLSNKPALKKLLNNMEEALLSASDPKGVGLAAPQIGKSLAVFLAKPTDVSPIYTFINPKIIDIKDIKKKKTKSKSKKLEGCLSLPNIWGEVVRADSVKLSYFDENGDQIEKKFKGFMATIVQHEMDHLNGILFPKHVLEQENQLYKSHKNDAGEDEFEEISI